jgi:SPP1 family predicted phage head-tail adaptor
MILGGRPTNPGELRTAVTLLQRTVTQDAGGFQSQGTSSLGSVMAKWRNVHGQEAWAAASLGIVAGATVLIRYVADLDETCLVQKGTELYQIVSIDDVEERHEYLELKLKIARPE